MVRFGIDWIGALVSENDNALNDRIREAYLAAYSVLQTTHDARTKSCQQHISEAASEDDFQDSRHELMCEDHRWSEQTQALTTMALTLIACTNKSFLDQMKRLFTRSHPPDPSYRGPSQLGRQIAEYKARFGVDLERIDGFEAIREVELARHCCVHDEGRLSKDYQDQTQQRLVGPDEYIDITPGILDALLLDTARFAHRLSAEMKAVRDKSIKPAAQETT